MIHTIHIAAISQIRLDTDGRAYYQRKLAAGKTRREALRSLKRGVAQIAARPAHTRTPVLRISHFPDPHPRRYP